MATRQIFAAQLPRNYPRCGGYSVELAIPRAKLVRNFCKRSAKNAAKFWRNVLQIFVLQFQGKWPQKISQKILDIFHSAPNRVFFTAATLGAGGPNIFG